MAVVALPPFKSNLDLWGASNSAIYPSATSAPMTDIMSYQYPPPPSHSGADMDIPPSGYYAVPPQSSSGIDMRSGPDSGHGPRDRSDSFSKSMKLKRSLSTPTAGPLSQPSAQHTPTSQQSAQATQDALALAAEKRRNKLGYHRTSVACGKFSTWNTLTALSRSPW
jgi:hypothetical protein